MARVLEKLHRLLGWGPADTFDWSVLLPELKQEIRARTRKTAAALLALTCQEEYAAGRESARNYLVTLAFMPREEYSIFTFFRERVTVMDSHRRGLVYHAIATSSQHEGIEIDYAITLLLLACPTGSSVNVCLRCKWLDWPYDYKSKAERPSVRICGGNGHGEVCHAPRSLSCAYPDCNVTGCVRHMRQIVCRQGDDDISYSHGNCTRSYSRCVYHRSEYWMPPGWTTCVDCWVRFCPDCVQTDPSCVSGHE